MGLRALYPSNDYWANEFDPGTASSWVFAGVEGLARLSGPASVFASDADRFRAELTRMQLDHVALEGFSASEHTWTRTAAHVAEYSTPMLLVLLLQEGTMAVRGPDGPFTLHAGQHVLVDSRDPFAYRTSGAVRLLRTMIGVEHVPPRLQSRGATSAGPLHPTQLSESFAAFGASILATTDSGHRARGDQLVRALADLQIAVLAEAQQLSLDPDDPAGLRWRMEEHIEAHYAESNLDQAAVARALGVSLHRARAAFNDGARTIPGFIRDRRVAAAAAELRTSVERVQYTDLARRHGFGSVDTFTRAFHERFGATPAQYRERGHETPW